MVTNLQPVTVSCLKLTHWGEIFLSAFPQEAISWADTHFSRSSINAADPFKKLVRLCVDWCNQQGVKPLWAPMYQQQRLQGQPADAPMYVPNSPKVKGPGGPGLGSSATSPGSVPSLPDPLAPDQILISGTRYRVLSETETHQRQADFISNQDCVTGIDKLALLLGKQTAADYFKRVFDNLKYEQV